MSAEKQAEMTESPTGGCPDPREVEPGSLAPALPSLGSTQLPAESYAYVEVGCYQPSKETGEMEPVQLSFEGQEGLGRGVVIPVERLPDFASLYRRGAQRSHFHFSTPNLPELIAAREAGSLVMMGDYYFVFNAKSSSEMVHSINQAIDLVELLKENYDVPYDAAAVYYDGRAIEVHIDHAVFGIQPGADLPQTFRRMTALLIGVDPAESQPPSTFSQLNLDAYRSDYMSGLPGTQVRSEPDTYCVRLSYTGFKRMSYQRLNEFVARRPDLPPREPHTQSVPAAAELYRTLAVAHRREAQDGFSDAISKIFYRVDEERGQIATAKQLAPAMLKRLFSENRQLIGTFSPHLDRCLGGGFNPGDLYVIAGFPGSGTSSLVLQLMNWAAEHHSAHCVFVGLQRGVEELFKRSLSHVGQIPVCEIDAKRRNPRALQEDSEFGRRITAALERYQTFADRIVILEGAAAADLPHLTQFVRERKEELRTRGGDGNNVLLIIDSLQLMVAVMRAVYNRPDATSEPADIFGAVGEADVRILAGRLKALARELDITVLATLEHYDANSRLDDAGGSHEGLSQLFFDTQFADTVMLLSRWGASLKPLGESLRRALAGTPLAGEVENTVQRIAGLEKKYQATEEFKRLDSEFAVLDILKNRSGPVEKVALCFHKRFSHFEPLEYTDPPA